MTMKAKIAKITLSELRKIICEEIECHENLIDEMATSPEAYNAKELGVAADQSTQAVKDAATEWIENIWGLGQASGDKNFQNFAKQANQVLGQLLKKAPVFQSGR